MTDELLTVDGTDFDLRLTPQFYETVIIPTVAGELVTVTVGTIPVRAIAESSRRKDIGTLEGLLELVGVDNPHAAIPLKNLRLLTTAVALMIDPELNRSDTLSAVWARFLGYVDRPEATARSSFFSPPWWADGRDSALTVGERLVFETSIPFESSPLSGATLSSIISGSGGSALVVTVLEGLASPWLLVAVPTGVVVMKVAHAAGDALGAVVKQRILRWLEPELLIDERMKSMDDPSPET